MRVRIGAPLAALVVMAPASAFAVDYLGADQAARMMFPQAERFERSAQGRLMVSDDEIHVLDSVTEKRRGVLGMQPSARLANQSSRTISDFVPLNHMKPIFVPSS